MPADLGAAAASLSCLPSLPLTRLPGQPPLQEEFVSVVEFVDVQGVFHDLGTKKIA